MLNDRFSEPFETAGAFTLERFTGQALIGNPLNDPAERVMWVYTPPGYADSGRRYPVIYFLHGYLGRVDEYWNWAGWRPGFPRAIDDLFSDPSAEPAIVVLLDAWTRIGGSQYLNSSATGRYEDHVVTEVVAWVRERYRTGPTAVLGTSSGGFGALVLGLRHPEVFGAVGSNAGDAYFEYCYPPEFPTAFREIRREGGPEAFLHRVFTRPISAFGPTSPIGQTLATMAYASCYGPIDSEPGRFDLPFDLEDGTLRADVWPRWLAWDPVRMIAEPGYAAAARRLKYLYVDGGRQDEYGLDVGARAFAAAARRQGVPVEHAEYEGVHADRGPRYDVMIPKLLSGLGFPAPGTRPSGLL